MTPTYDDFERAIATGDLTVIEAYMALDDVREEVAAAELGYKRQSTYLSFPRNRPDGLKPEYVNRYPKTRLCGGECLVKRTYGRVHNGVLLWFFSPAQVPTMGSMLAYTFNCFLVAACRDDDLEALEVLLTSQVFMEVLRVQRLQQPTLDDLLKRAWGVFSPEVINMLFAHGAQCDPEFARDFVNGPLGLVEPLDNFDLLSAHGIPTIGGHEFAISAKLGSDRCSPLYKLVQRLELFSKWDPSIITGDILRVAARNERSDLVRFCLEKGFVDVDSRSSNHQTALMVTTHQEVMFWRKPDQIGEWRRWEGWCGREPYVPSRFHYRHHSNTPDQIMMLLLSYSADVSLKDKYGHTALHHAVKHGRPPLVEILVKAGADIHARTKWEETVLDQIDLDKICKVDLQELFLRLVALGADPFAIGKQYQSVLDRLVETEDGFAFVSAHREQFLVKQGWVVDSDCEVYC